MLHPILARAEEALKLRLRHDGDLSLLDRPRRLLLISRAQRHPTPETPWLAASVAAARRVAARGEVLVAGAGRKGWDAALRACAQADGQAIVGLKNASGQALRKYAPKTSLFLWPEAASSAANGCTDLQRDSVLGLLSDRAYAIHVREKGNMAALRQALESRGCPVEPWVSTAGCGLRIADLSAPKQNARAETSKTPSSFCQQAAGALQAGRENWDCLTHFTREPEGGWPGEDYCDYLDWLCAGSPFAPRDGFAALCRIIHEQRLRANGRLMPGGAPMVCFTARHPVDILAARRWRRGLQRWSFTPYGLAIAKDELLRHGVRAVRYGSRKALTQAPPDERRFMQVAASAGMDWTQEAEWRASGDVDLSATDRSRMLALVARPEEARQVREMFGIECSVVHSL